MNQQQVREIVEKLPPKRKQVLLKVLAGESKAKIACELCDGSEDAVQQHLRQLYKNFGIQGDEERKRHSLLALFANIKQNLIGDNCQSTEVVSSKETTINALQYYSKFTCTAYKEETWVGREEELRQLSEKLRGECRILIITGITGQGKTALAERLASVELREWYLLTLNFDDGVQTRDFVGAAESLLIQLNEMVTDEERKQPEQLLFRLVEKLRNNRYLVQIDSFEVLLKGKDENGIASNDFQDEHQRWWNFFNSLLVGRVCQSRLILTSQDSPTQFQSCNCPEERWIVQELKGLSDKEPLEFFEKLFQQKGKEISPISEEADYLLKMGNAYEGHPLVIKVIAGEILDKPWNSNIVAYWQKYHQEFEVVSPTTKHQRLENSVKKRVRETLMRLAQDIPYAHTLLLRSSVYRLPVTEYFWLAMLQGLTDEEKKSALQTLKYRYLLEEVVIKSNKHLIRQHNLIRNVVYQRLIEISNKGLELQSNHYIAAQMWRTAYQPEPDASNLEQVRGYLEAFHHYCEVEDWKKSSEILEIQINDVDKTELHNQLSIWGYYQEQINLYIKILGKISRSVDLICFSGIGNAFDIMGNYNQAIYHYEQSLAIAEHLDYRKGIGKMLGNLGNTYSSLENYEKAVDYYQQCLLVLEEVGTLADIGRTLGNLGTTYLAIGDYEKAFNYSKQHLDYAYQDKDILGIGTALCNFRNVLIKLEDYLKSLEILQFALKIFRQNQERNSESYVLYNLAIIYQELARRDLALEHCEQALALATELGIPLAQECQKLKEELLKEN